MHHESASGTPKPTAADDTPALNVFDCPYIFIVNEVQQHCQDRKIWHVQ
jgi:hypothetical protein